MTSSTTNIEAIRTLSLPIYYNNSRSVVNKRMICTRIELSVYKILCFTETKLGMAHSSCVYFPRMFDVYRFDRKSTAIRLSGGVAILVHHTLESKQIAFSSDINFDADCEFVAIEVIMKPQSLIIYVCYLRTFDMEIAMMHYHRIKFIVDKYRNHSILILGDFNLFDIVWTPDDDNDSVFLPHTSVDVVNNVAQRIMKTLWISWRKC